mmetsp:Transcript_63560/g.207283  ORF Transcript_63560/g.207283 Transcript_63560/m.207283 type:complete len:533 (-) Transcript_63560:437-2035(-)
MCFALPVASPTGLRARLRRLPFWQPCCCRESTSIDPGIFMPQHTNTGIEQRYKIDAEVGQGAHGCVSIGCDLACPDRKVAIKKMAMSSEKREAAFRKEIQIMKSLDHPNICKLYETYEDWYSMSLVMEYCEGGDLYQAIADRQALGEPGLDEPFAAHVVLQVAEAMKYAHGRGIVHRDLKPENICFFGADRSLGSQVKVVDWGISSINGKNHYGALKRMHTHCGTLVYSAPEVHKRSDAKGRGYTAACDVWSLGVVTYVMLCGELPFGGPMLKQMADMDDERFYMVKRPWTHISQHAKDLVRGLLRARPEHRLSLDTVLAHPWLQRNVQQGPTGHAALVVSDIQQSRDEQSQLRLVCASACVRQLDHESLKELATAFHELDENKDGFLCIKELRRGFKKVFEKGSEQLAQVDEIFERCDLDKNGKINYTEFCAVGLNQRLLADETLSQAAFTLLHESSIYSESSISRSSNRPKTGFSKDEFAALLRSMRFSAASSDTLFEAFDKDCDGVLDFEEWRTMLRESPLTSAQRCGL